MSGTRVYRALGLPIRKAAGQACRTAPPCGARRLTMPEARAAIHASTSDHAFWLWESAVAFGAV